MSKSTVWIWISLAEGQSPFLFPFFHQCPFWKQDSILWYALTHQTCTSFLTTKADIASFFNLRTSRYADMHTHMSPKRIWSFPVTSNVITKYNKSHTTMYIASACASHDLCYKYQWHLTLVLKWKKWPNVLSLNHMPLDQMSMCSKLVALH